ncbi:MAG: tubulin/FtsZ family protein, partial [Chloroflexota bacterium]
MKLVVVGLGQCGGRIADEFARLNGRARSRRGMTIITGCFAVNTDQADLSGLSSISNDHRHRILIGSRKTGGHGVGKINELGAEIAREDADKIIDAIRTTKKFFETDAFLLIAGSAGGTGSGAISIITQHLKERYIDKPIWNLIVLPFEHEESTEERTVFNVATCIKSCYSVADAVFLVDNQRYVRKDSSIQSNMSKINSMIAEPFYNLLCAGEEKKSRYIGAKLLDAGDIIQTVVGWTVVGYGKTQAPLFKWPTEWKSDFRKKGLEIQKGIQAMDEAISELSLKCNPADSRRALYLVSGPAKEMNMDMVKEIGDYMRDIAPEAIIRNGDYPHERGLVDVTVLLSELS